MSEEQTRVQETNCLRAHVFISGRVQGVYFREYTRREAEKVGVKGWVRNLWDGRVEAVFEGPPDAVRHMVRWCHRGSPRARVERVEVHYEDCTGEFDRFRVIW